MIPNDVERSGMVPPYDENAERAFIGSLFFMNSAIDAVRPDPEIFYSSQNQLVAETIVMLWDSDCKAIDAVTVGNELARTGRLEDAGGVPYLMTLSESVPHAEHVRYYAKIVREKYQLRQLIQKCEQVLSEARRPDSNIQHIVEHAAKMLQESRIGSHSRLTFKDAWHAAFQPRPMRECIIEGMLRRAEVGNFIASTKTGKSWFALMLLICIATGRDWLGRRVARGSVLLIDNELHDETIENRIATVRHAMNIEPDTHRERFEYVSCRGDWISIQDLIEGIPVKHPPGSLNMIVIDAKYRLFGNGLEENSNDDQTTFHNMIDQFAKAMDCPVVLVHHSTKGDQSGKSVTDVGSGGGSQSRAVDLHMTIRPHQQPGLAVLEGAVRSFAPIEPMTLRWNWPIWTVASDVEPVLPKNSKDGERREDMRARMMKHLTEEWQSVSSLADRCSTQKGRPPFVDILDDLQREGIAEIRDDFIPKNTKRVTSGIRFSSDKTTSNTVGSPLSEVSG
jgi:hypothetical protein